MTIFLKIVDAGNFTMAAKQLNIPLASVSYHLSKLEEQLGIRLLNRTTRKVSLTDSGELYAERCRHILAEVEEVDNMLTKLHNEPTGSITINSPCVFGTLYLARYVDEFIKRYPKVKINITLNDQFIDVLEAGADIVLRISRQLESGFVTRKLSPIDIIFCASPEYLTKHGEPQLLSELSQHNCLQYSYYQGQRWRAAGPDGLEKIKISGNLISNNDDILKTLATAGHGIIYLPSFVVYDELQNGNLKQILNQYNEQGYYLYALYPHTRSLSAKTRAFIDFLIEKFESEPHWN